MRITIVADTFGLENNGTTITLTRLINGLLERGHTVKMVSPFRSDDPMFYTLPKRNFFIFNRYVRKNGVELARPKTKILKNAILDSDIVHIAVPFKAGVRASEICRKYGVPFTTAFHIQAENVTSHFFVQNIEAANSYIYRKFWKRLYRYSDFVHCPSPRIADILRKHGYNMNLRVISNGVLPCFTQGDEATARERERHGKYVVSFVGRYVREKRHDLLIDAVALSKYSDKIQLIFPGGGPLERAIRQHGKILKNPPIMRFCERDELIQVLQNSDLYVHPSDIEIEAIACLEAISCGAVPVISDSKKSATNAFALTEHNLFDHTSAQALADKIDFFIEHPEEKSRERQMYARYAKQFAIETCIDKMVSMFTDAIEANNHKEGFAHERTRDSMEEHTACCPNET